MVFMVYKLNKENKNRIKLKEKNIGSNESAALSYSIQKLMQNTLIQVFWTHFCFEELAICIQIGVTKM